MSTRFEFTNRARPIMEVGLGSSVIDISAALWDVALWDAPTSTWNGDEPLWRDFSCDVIDTHIELGRGRITDSFPVGVATVTVDNHSGWADPSTADVDSSVGYFSFPGTEDNYVSVDDYAALGITGDICMVFRFRTAQWPPPAFTGQVFWKDGAYGMLLQTNANLQLWTSTVIQSGLFTPATDWRWVAVCVDVNNGAGGHDWKWWYGGTGDNPGAWIEYSSGTDTGTLVIVDTADPLRIGTQVADGFVGDISHLSIRSGTGPTLTVGGTTVFEFNGWDLTEADVTAASITPRVGSNPMVVNRSGSPTTEVVAAVQPAGTQLRLRPGRAIRVGVVHQTLGTRWLYRGFIDAIEPVDDPEDWSTVKLSCIDSLGEGGRAKLPAAEESGAGEEAHTRFTRTLDTIQWPGTLRSVSTSAIRPLYAAALEGQVVDLLRQTAESEGGWAFGDTDGRIVLQHRDWLYHAVNDPVDAIIGNLSGDFFEMLLESGDFMLLEDGDELLLEAGNPTGVCPGRWTRTFDRRDITTRVILDRDLPAGVDALEPVVADDLQAQILYGIEPFERLDLWTQNTGDLQQIAGRILATRSANVSMPRVQGVELAGSTGDDAVDLMSSLSIFTPSRYRGLLITERGVVFDDNFFAVGVIHDMSSEEWTADISLDKSFPFSVLDPADYIWDTARWDRSLWN